MRFEFATANRVIFGEGVVSELRVVAPTLGTRVLFVTGNSVDRSAAQRADLADAGLHVEILPISGEPTVSMVKEGLQFARSRSCDVVVAMGGGSVLDAGKAIAGLVPNTGDLYDYLEVVGKGMPLQTPGLPLVAVPTTAGTGSEVTRNAVLSVPEKRVKVSLRHASMLPRVAIVDPRLTFDLPPAVTASAGLDALVQLIEPFLSVAANPMVDALCREGIRRIAGSLRTAWVDGSDAEARLNMSLGALFSGMALANAKLGAVHGFAGPIGGRLAAPHGAICARLLPPVLSANLAALQQRAPESPVLDRFAELGRLLTGNESADAQEAVDWVTGLRDDLHVPALASYGLSTQDFPELMEASKQSSSMKGNPIPLTDEELRSVLLTAM